MLLILIRFGYFGLVKVVFLLNILSIIVSGKIKGGIKFYVNISVETNIIN